MGRLFVVNTVAAASHWVGLIGFLARRAGVALPRGAWNEINEINQTQGTSNLNSRQKAFVGNVQSIMQPFYHLQAKPSFMIQHF